MAKLTARFDIQDKISKKLRTIRGEIDSLERSRERVNRPMTMRVKDQATNVLKKLHMFVLKDIAKSHMLVIQLRDQASKPLNALSNFMRRKMPKTHNMLVRANDKATSVARKISHYVKGNIVGVRMMQIRASDKAMPVIRKVGNLARSTLSKGFNFTVRGVDMASRVVGRVASFTATSIPRVRDFTIRAINGAANVISSVKRAIFSIPTLITVTLAAVGIGNLGKSTIGSAMNFEDYGVAMNHWLNGDEKAQKDLMKWMGQKADITPFNSADIFPAMTGAVALAGNDPDSIKRLTSAAIDMAALTPGKSVEDAMEALSMAKMGSFMQMRGYGPIDGEVITKKSYDAMGGWNGFIGKVEKNFKDGALKLSDTGRGQLNMLKGYMSSQFRSMGDGVLESMKPRLQAVTQWLLDNPKAWGKWKKTVEGLGAQAGEFVFSKLEKGFMYLKTNYLENDVFKNLDFKGKIKFISEDIGHWWSSKGKKELDKWWNSSGKPWAEKIGLFMGKSIFDGIVLGVKEGSKGLGGMWTDALKKPSVESVGGAGVATLLAVSIASLVLSPLLTAVSLMSKGVRGAVNAGKKIKGFFSKSPTPTSTPVVSGTGRKHKPVTAPKQNQVYRMPWTNKGAQPNLSVPNAGRNAGSKFLKMPKGLSSIGNFAKRIPVLGTALGALTIANASRKDKAGAVGGVGGGLAGAATGAAIGSVVPVVGTAIGGIIGGIVGSLGGQAIGDWLSENWTSIKSGASATGKWISQKFNDSVEWISNTWSSFTDWFSSSVWQPISEGAGAAVKWVSDKWSALTGWFSGKVWDPLVKGFDKSISFIVGLYDIGETFVKAGWSLLSGWFKEKVWTPLKTAAGVVWDWISTRVSTIWTGIQVLWGMASSWFTDTVWTPLSTAASIAWEWIKTSISDAWLAVQTLWGIAVTWFQETIWTPLMTAVGVVGTWIGEKFTEGWTAVTALWGVATGWFEETVWTPLNTAVGLLGTWIGDKFMEGWNVVSDIWGVASSYFEENIWTPIKTGAGLVKDAIIKPFEEAWEFVSGIFTKLGDTWDTIKQWGGKAVEWTNDAVDYVVDRGEKRRGITEYARGTNFHPGGPAIVGDGGGPELIRYPNGGMSLSPGTDTMMNLPRGTEVLSHRKTVKFFNQTPAYADGVGFGGGVPEKVILPEGQVAAASSKSGSKQQSIGSKARDIIIEITGDNHYSDEMDAEKVGKIAYDYIKKALQNERFEGGEMVVDG